MIKEILKQAGREDLVLGFKQILAKSVDRKEAKFSNSRIFFCFTKT